MADDDDILLTTKCMIACLSIRIKSNIQATAVQHNLHMGRPAGAKESGKKWRERRIGCHLRWTISPLVRTQNSEGRCLCHKQACKSRPFQHAPNFATASSSADYDGQRGQRFCDLRRRQRAIFRASPGPSVHGRINPEDYIFSF